MSSSRRGSGAVLCAGLATRDTIWRTPEHPAKDGRVVASDLRVAGGGPAATAAVTLARLGVETRFAGAVGDDEAGTFVRDGLAAEGVDVSALAVVRSARTAQSAILVGPAGTRSIVHYPGDAAMPDLDESLVRDAAWLHVDHAVLGRGRPALPPPVRDLPVQISVDGGNPIAGLDLTGVALYAPTEAALAVQFGDARTAVDAGAALVVVTRSARGSVATTRTGERVEAPGVPCRGLVSTLGAGDVFHGALLASLVRDLTLAEALRAANTAASLSCRALDGRSAVPTRAELEGALA